MTRIYNAIKRCTDPAARAYRHYGGRGIRVHKPWLRDRVEFLAYLVTLPGHDDPDLTMDRINNDGNYEPGNLRFVDHSTQIRNRRPRRRKAVPR